MKRVVLPWSQAEDAIVRAAVVAGVHADKIAAELPGRTDTAIRNRARRVSEDLPLGTQPHCLNRANCASASASAHCRTCTITAIRANPEFEARRREGMAEFFAKPETKARLAARIAISSAKANERPEVQERRRQHGVRFAREVLNRPDVRARNQSAEVRAAAGKQISATRLAHIPEKHRATYRYFIRTKRMLAADAQAAIEEIVAAETRRAHRAIANFNHRQDARAQREREQAY